METEQQIRQHIRHILEEAVNNFLQSHAETKTRQFKDNTKPEEIGDPISDVEMNQRTNETDSEKYLQHLCSASTKGSADQNAPRFSRKTK